MTDFLGWNTLLVALVGMMVVFLGLVVLILLINVMGKLTSGMGRKAEPKAAPVAVPAVAAAAPAVASLIKPDAQVRPAKIDDTTVAILTAAIAATRGEGYPFRIKRIVRVKR